MCLELSFGVKNCSEAGSSHWSVHMEVDDHMPEVVQGHLFVLWEVGPGRAKRPFQL